MTPSNPLSHKIPLFVYVHDFRVSSQKLVVCLFFWFACFCRGNSDFDFLKIYLLQVPCVLRSGLLDLVGNGLEADTLTGAPNNKRPV